MERKKRVALHLVLMLFSNFINDIPFLLLFFFCWPAKITLELFSAASLSFHR